MLAFESADDLRDRNDALVQGIRAVPSEISWAEEYVRDVEALNFELAESARSQMR